MIVVTKTPTPRPWYQPSCQVPFEFTVSADEAWQVQPVPAQWVFEHEGSIFTGTITIEGIPFVVNNAYPFTPTSFRVVVGDAKTTLNNLIGAISSRPEIMANWTWYLSNTTWGATITMVAKSAAYTPKTFDVSVVGYTPLVIFTPNVKGILKPNFKLAYQISVFNELHESMEIPCHPVQLVDTSIGQIITSEKVQVDFASIVNAHLGSTLITSQCDRPVWDYGLGRNFRIRYGTSTRLNGSNEVYLNDAGTFFIIKQNLDTVAGVEPYVRLLDNTYKGKLFNQFFDTGLPLHQNSVAWAYLYYNSADYLSITPPVSVKIRIFATQTDVNGLAVGVHETRELVIDDLNYTRYGVAAIPIGFANLGLVRVPEATHVKIDFFVDRTMPDNSVETVNLFSNTYRLSNCFEGLECYFLSRTGAYETLMFEEFYTATSEVTQQEYKPFRQARNFLPPTDNVGDYLERNKLGSAAQYAANASRQYKVKLRARPTKELADFLESFLTSPSRYIKVKYDGTYGILYTHPFTISHSATEIEKNSGLLNFEATLVVDSTNLL